MLQKHKERLAERCRGKIRFDQPLAPYTTFRVGGPAEGLYEARNRAELREVLGYLQAQDIPYVPIGRGSNLLVADEGVAGVVILLRGELAGMRPLPGEPALLAGAGLSLAALLVGCRRHGIGGLEFLTGIPGTVGGAVAMNAGAFGASIGCHVREIEMVDPGCGRLKLPGSELSWGYRHLGFKNGSREYMGRPGGPIIVSALLEGVAESRDTITRRMEALAARRRAAQPVRRASAGSVFKNPPGAHAAQLIERAGLKGTRVGGAAISRRHANFIVNEGGARAQDILALIELVRERVAARFGILLETEIRMLGGREAQGDGP